MEGDRCETKGEKRQLKGSSDIAEDCFFALNQETAMTGRHQLDHVTGAKRG
jgi:hypothetical protein